VIVTGLSAEPLDVAALVARIRRADCGTTRSPSDGKDVARLSYEAFERRATEQLDALAREAIARFGVRAVVAMHRTGDVPVGEPSVLVACAAPHRAEAFEAARWLIDSLKRDVAIWKAEAFADGSTSWVGAEPDPRAEP